MTAAVAAWLDGWASEDVPVETLRRARVMQLGSIVACLSISPFAVWHVLEGNPHIAAAIVGTLLLVILCRPILVVSGSATIAGNWVVLLAQGLLFWVMSRDAGLLSPVVPYLVFGPLIAHIFAGPRVMLAWCLLSTLGLIGMFGLHHRHPIFHYELEGYRLSLMLFCAVGAQWLLVAVTVMFDQYLYRQLQADALAELREKHAELLAAQEREAQAWAARASFLSLISHELRTPLNGIMGMSEVLSLGELTDDQRSANAAIHDSSQHLLSIISAVLDFTSHAPVKTLRHIQPSALLSDFAAYRPALPDDDTPVLCDAENIQNILRILLDNALKHGGGEIQLSLEREDDVLRLSVADRGTGIPEADCERIFEPFVILGEVRQRKHDGLGLGLSIARQHAEVMEGTLHAAPRTGGGSVLTLTLPLPPT